MFEAVKNLFKKSEETTKEVSLEEAPEEVSDSAGQEGYNNVAEIEEFEYESE